MKIFAHRGYSAKYPENTLSAFQAVANIPIYGVEFDVHLTKDGEMVIIHDERIDRTSNGTGFVKDMTLQTLRQYDFGSWFDKTFEGEKIPTLSEVLEIFENTNHVLNIEIKSDIFPYEGLLEKVLELVKKKGFEKRVIISSFDHEVIERLTKVHPNIDNAALFLRNILNMVDYQNKLHANALHVFLPGVFRKPVLDAIKIGRKVRAFTVNDIEHANMLKGINIDGIFTDEVEKMWDYYKIK